MIPRVLALVLLCLADVGVAMELPADCGNVSTRYFSWSALKVYPPRPTNPQSEAWAKAQEANGASHYIAEYCKDGRIVSLTKRLNKRVFFRYDYSYDSGKLAGVRLTDADGKTQLISGG